jgi:raffinose/stachyose/melibiose transport system permease protein
MMIYLAGLQGIPQELEEAAIDGPVSCGGWPTSRSPAGHVYHRVVLTFERGLQDFDSIFALTGGGPGAATMTMALNITRESFYFSRPAMGRRSAWCSLW